MVTVGRVLDTDWLAQLAARPVPTPPTPSADGFAIAAWSPDGEFHRLFHGVLVYESPTERRYFVPHGSRVWNFSHGGWSAWRTRHPSFKRFLIDRWWNETLMGDPTAGRYYDVASPPWFGPMGVGYVDLYLDIQKRRGRLRVVDQREWEAFLLEHPVDDRIHAAVAGAIQEASRYGATAWRNAWDRMEGECRRWVKALVVDAMRGAGAKPSPRVLASDILGQVLDQVAASTGRRLPTTAFGKTPSERLPRSVYEHLTAMGASTPRRSRVARPGPRRSP